MNHNKMAIFSFLVIMLPRQQTCPVVDFVHRTSSSATTRCSAIAEGPRDESCQLKSCLLPCNKAEKLLVRQVLNQVSAVANGPM